MSTTPGNANTETGLQISIEIAPIERIPGDLTVIGLCEEDCARPLRGPAARADWRACGLLTEQIASGRFVGAPDDVLLVAARGLATRRLLVVGLGSREGYGAKRCGEASARALQRAYDLRALQVVFATPGVAPDDFARHAGAVVAAGNQVMASAASGESLLLRIPVQPSEGARSQSAVLEFQARGQVQLLQVPGTPRPSVPPAAPAGSAHAASPSPRYPTA